MRDTPRHRDTRMTLWCMLSALLLVIAACSSSDSTTEAAATDADSAGEASDESNAPEETEGVDESTAGNVSTDASCDEIAAQFGTDGSANADLPDPVSSAVCDGTTVVVTSNGIPDYPYVETSPGPPNPQDLTFELPAIPVVADEPGDVPLLGALGVTLAGVPIYGPTEGTGGDVGSIAGILMDCGGHNGPTGFHLHLVGTSESSDCDFSAEEIASGPQLLVYAFDGYPIYTGNAQYTSSWTLTDESLFASDTWNAHSFVEGSGDLDECNGTTDENGDYAYYTTDTFPYVLGCFVGETSTQAGAGGGQGPPPGGGERRGPPPADG